MPIRTSEREWGRKFRPSHLLLFVFEIVCVFLFFIRFACQFFIYRHNTYTHTGTSRLNVHTKPSNKCKLCNRIESNRSATFILYVIVLFCLTFRFRYTFFCCFFSPRSTSAQAASSGNSKQVVRYDKIVCCATKKDCITSSEMSHSALDLFFIEFQVIYKITAKCLK